MSTLRVLHLLSSSAFHGAESMTVELIRQSAKLGVECHLVMFDNNGRGNTEAGERLRDVCASTSVAPSRWQFDPAAVAHIAKLVRRAGIHVVHSHKYKTTFHALLARRQVSTPLVCTYHNWVGEGRIEKIYEAMDRFLVRYVDAAVAVSGEVEVLLRSCRPRGPVYRIDNGVDTDRFSPAGVAIAEHTASFQKVIVVGFVGRLTRKKGVIDLLQACARIATSRPFELLIVGDGELRGRLETDAASLGLSSRVRFLGTQRDMAQIYRGMDLLALPSHAEGFPMVILEALSSGIPVICTDVGDCHRIVIPGETGWLVTSGDVAGLASTLDEALADTGRLQRFGQAGRALVSDKYSARRMAESYLAVYNRALDKN